MGFIKKLKKLIAGFDFFSQPVTLRYQQDPQYKSFTGGLCSLLMVIIFIAIFFGTALATINKEKITASVTQFEEQDPTYFSTSIQSKFMFAVGIDQFNLNQGKKYFQITMQKRNYSANSKVKLNIPLQKCQRQQWSKISQKLGQTYDRLGFEKWLCPPENIIIELQGKFTSEIFQYYKIGVSQCNPKLPRGCVDNATINSYLAAQEVFNFNFYFVNVLLNPGNAEVVSYFLQDTNYFPFSPTAGISANLFIQSFKIETDQSIFPFEDYSEVTGGIVRSKAQSFNYDVKQTEYLRFYLRKSSVSLLVARSFRKVDDTVSYVGGLFSAIVSLLVFMGKFNQISFELDLAKNLFYHKETTTLNTSSFNLLSYIGFSFYSFLSFLGVSLSWNKMKVWDESLDQIRKQLDIRLIMKRINLFEKIIHGVLQKGQFDGFQYCKPSTLQQAAALRTKYKSRKRVRCLIQRKKCLQNLNSKMLVQEQLKVQNRNNNSKNQVASFTQKVGNIDGDSDVDMYRNGNVDPNIDNVNADSDSDDDDDDFQDEFNKQAQGSAQSQSCVQKIVQQQFEKNMNNLYQNIEHGKQVSLKIITMMDPKIKQFYEKKRKEGSLRNKYLDESCEILFKRNQQ